MRCLIGLGPYRMAPACCAGRPDGIKRRRENHQSLGVSIVTDEPFFELHLAIFGLEEYNRSGTS